jgi:16S rRNA (guanine527-N7)-methyltransferase
MAELLKEGLEALGVPEPERVQLQMETFVAELERWNPRFGLVKYADRDELVVKHVLDSLSAWREVAEAAAAGPVSAESAASGVGAVLDVGSGAGFPGIPLAVALPGLSFTLLERMSRRATFLKTCSILLGLRGVTVVQNDLAAIEGSFAVVTFRALAPLPRIVEDLERSAVRWGSILAYKGREARAREEVEAVVRSGGGRCAAEVRPLATPFLDEERCLAVVKHCP